MSSRTTRGRRTLSTEDFVRAGRAVLDERGLAGFGLKSIGDALGVDPSAMYRHFRNVEALMEAIADDFFAEVLADAPEQDLSSTSDARYQVREFLHAFRDRLLAHPNLAPLLASGGGRSPHQLEVTRRGLAMLGAMGLSGATAVRAYQALESFAMGGVAFDVGGAPDHLEIRRLRFRAVEHPWLDEAVRTTEDVAIVSAAAFEFGLEALLDACERAAAQEPEGR